MVQVKTDMTGWVMAEHGVPDSRWTVVERAEDYVSPTKDYQERALERNQRFKNTTGRVRPKDDIVGKKFGVLTVLEQIEDYISPNGAHWAQYRCECDCGNFVNVKGVDLTRKETTDHKPKTHCGCLSTMNRSEAQRKQNIYRFEEDAVVGVTYNTGDCFFADLEDFELIKDYCWFVHEDDTGYKSLVARVPGTDKHIKMSHLLGFKNYDHINRNSLDNRKSNFRKADNTENMRNRSLFSNNKSGVTGVYWAKDKDRWVASVKINKKDKYLGAFADKEDAIKARLQAEADYYGAFAPQQHLFEQYDIKTTQND